ncbi:MAG: WecB/TagA/CpsF family glycosyltransferase [Proteobacteria bacterium]|nr:WecB/TagA/CpsF family glycosyltransferase [Pseudomonadota bacterium]
MRQSSNAQKRKTRDVDGREILGTRVDATSYAHATNSVLEMVREDRSGYICIANVHMIMEAHDSPAFRSVVNSADLVTPDGVPLVWMMRLLGIDEQTRVYGPTLMLRICETAAEADVPVGLLGATHDVLCKLENNLKRRFEKLNIAYAHAPPFRQLSDSEINQIVSDIRESKARILFIGLGCPKQEIWMADNTHRIQAVMLGVGAAFDFHAGTMRQSPEVIQRLGLEWLFRLTMEPGRLWRRYLLYNPRFMWLAFKRLIAKLG